MSKYRYWRADAESSAKIVGWMDEWQRAIDAARQLAKSMGSKDVYTSHGPGGDPYVAGFAFDQPPDKKQFVKLKGTDRGYRPRSGTDLDKQFDQFKCRAASETMKLVGIKMTLEFDEQAGGFCMPTVGINVVGKVAYLTTCANVARGCKRISDIEFERATKPKAKRKTA